MSNSTYSRGFSRGFSRNNGGGSNGRYNRPLGQALTQPVTKASKNYHLYVQVPGEAIVDGKGQVIGNEPSRNMQRMQGVFMGIKNKDRAYVDGAGRHYIAFTVEIEPGKDRFAQTVDPVIQEQLMSASVGDIVFVEGETQRGNSGSVNARVTTFQVLERLTPEPPPPASAGVVSIETGRQTAA